MKRLRAGAEKWLKAAYEAVGGVPSMAEAAGLLLVTGGLWLVWPPAALIVAGVGCVLWAQGARTEG